MYLNTTEMGDIISDLERTKPLAMFHSTQVPPCALNSKAKKRLGGAPCISTLQDGTSQFPESGHIRHVASHLNCPVEGKGIRVNQPLPAVQSAERKTQGP